MRLFRSILLIAIGALLLWLYFNPKEKPVDFSDTSKYRKLHVVTDTLREIKTVTRYKKGDSIPYAVLDTIYEPIHDTIRLISEFYQVKAYSDTIKKDSNTFVINDTISQNKIQSRGFEAHFTEKTIIKREYYVQNPTNSVFWGVRGNFSQLYSLEGLSTGLMLNAKNKALIGLNLDISKNNNIGYSGSLYFKIR